MRPTLALPALALVSALLAPPAAAQEAARVPPVSEQRARADRSPLDAVYQRFLDGLRLRDTTLYRDLLTPDYIHVWGDSAQVSVGRSARLRWDMEQPGSTRVFQLLKCETQAYGDAAVGPCWFRQVGTDGGREYDWTGMSLVTFVRGADRQWRIAATRPSLARVTPR